MTGFDLIVAGAGAAGYAAAIDAGRAGARVLVLDVSARVGGAAAMAGGGTFAVDTPLQRSLGIEDSPDLALAEWLAWGGPEVDVTWAERYIRHSVDGVYEWAEELGVEWIEVYLHEGNSVARWHFPRGAGVGFVARMHEAATALGAEVRTGHRVVGLLGDEGGVAGVAVRSAGGDEEIGAPAVLLATGGYTGSAELVDAHGPRLAEGGRLLLGGAPSATGDGLRMLEHVGAALEGLDRIWVYPYGTPDDLDPEGRRGMAVRGVRNEIWVNADGRRFHDEDLRGGRTGTAALLAQRPPWCWAIMDAEEVAQLTLTDPAYGPEGEPDRGAIERFLERSPDVRRADTPEDLARAAGLPAAFAETLRGHNALLEAGETIDPAHGRSLEGLRPIDRGPLYAIRYLPMARKCLGGAVTDASCRVLRGDGAAIPGLYAAGEVAGMAGGHINGRAALEGTMFGPSLFSGRVAGAAAAVDVGEKYLQMDVKSRREDFSHGL